ncbi:MAG: glycogen/starch/alpha-glucan family phosphorylase, partial [Spirochaetes bacterium]|nr:glycogen/starch/alpha-glucan family phosphorylase [Spirochaetota bacterium]
KAWEITEKTFSYTNHTLLPEALEKWPVSLIQNLLPRHMQIIYEINKRFLKKASIKFFNNREKISNISLIEEGDERQVRMANLAVVGSHSVNGVAELHTKLLTKSVLKDFYAFCPEKFNNKTNGITQRRWLLLANPGLSELITDKIGSGWITNLSELKKLEKFSQDKDFQKDFMNIKMDNKKTLSKMILDETGISVNPEAIFDIQIKRMHEYKRQLLNVLHIIKLYLQMRKNPKLDITPRVFIFGGKSAPGYHMAKLIIKFITSVAEVVNNDPIISDKLKVVFYPNYRVSVAEKLFPAADISEQISTAGMEASGTGNMKFTLNGALTIGTLDGANVEIRKEVGNENFFLFGNTVEDLDKLKQKGYNPWDYYHKNEEIKEIIDIINSDFFSPDNTELFKPIYDTLMTWGDRYFLLADFASYSETHMEIDKTYRKKDKWAKMAIINVANSGKFSSDRTISDYAREIWKVKPVPIELTEEKE